MSVFSFKTQDSSSYYTTYFTSYFPTASLGLHKIYNISTLLWTVTVCVLEGSWSSFWKLCLPGDLTVSLQAHSRVMLCHDTLVQESTWGCLFLTSCPLLLCLWEQLGGNSVTTKVWVAMTYTSGNVLGGGTCMNWKWVVERPTDMILSQPG